MSNLESAFRQGYMDEAVKTANVLKKVKNYFTPESVAHKVPSLGKRLLDITGKGRKPIQDKISRVTRGVAQRFVETDAASTPEAKLDQIARLLSRLNKQRAGVDRAYTRAGGLRLGLAAAGAVGAGLGVRALLKRKARKRREREAALRQQELGAKQ